MKTAVQPVKDNGNGKFDPSTWAGQARMLARNEAQAMTLIWAMAMLAAGIVSVAIMRLIGMDWGEIFGIELALCALVSILALGMIYMWVYAQTLRQDTNAVRQATWRQEMALGMDLDGDGSVGQPKAAPEPAGHVVQVNGKPLVLPDLDRPREEPPLIHFPICANDVIYVVNRAAVAGLAFRAWDKQKLPSRKEIDRPLWSGIIDGLVAWQFATATVDAAGKRRASLREDVDIEEMLHAVRIGAGHPA